MVSGKLVLNGLLGSGKTNLRSTKRQSGVNGQVGVDAEDQFPQFHDVERGDGAGFIGIGGDHLERRDQRF